MEQFFCTADVFLWGIPEWNAVFLLPLSVRVLRGYFHNATGSHTGAERHAVAGAGQEVGFRLLRRFSVAL